MGLQCNIDQRGRLLRVLAGALIGGPGWLLIVLRFTGIVTGDWAWFVGGFLAFLGLVLVLQGALGWCALRAIAMGNQD
ncbi:MAG: hypothetical protein EXS03_08725 [Phycisphaerales bacterium]|nr:hypothetical protein [Phycisphaerales bacterium]